MQGKENIERQVGRRLRDGQLKSLYENGKVMDLINASFLKFDNEWVRIVCTDEQTMVDIENLEIKEYNMRDCEFEFRVQPIEKVFPGFTKYLDKKLLGFKELVLKNSEFMSFGLNLYFEDNLNFIIRNHDYPRDENEFYFETVDFDDLIEK
ncbi:MAG TPA: hypothetical protein VGK59_16275 [Ohtaekwangia sp.]